jgi:toxin-antitoxin system PIN domain toxin
MPAGDAAFVDTNVLIYASRPKAREHAAARAVLDRMRQEGSPLWLSQQVLREYLAAATRPQPSGPALPMAAAIADMQQFRTGFSIAEDTAGVLDRLVHLLSSHTGSGKQVHDANLVATMLETANTRLLTFNHADFRRFAGLIEIVVP